MHELVYPRERTLGMITLVLGLLIWLGVILGTYGVALIGLAFGFLMYLFAQSALISHIKGNGVELSEEQFPDLYKQFIECCRRLNIKKHPQVYILNGQGGFNAFATHFLGSQYVVLFSDVVDAVDSHIDGVRFYMGHELGHLRMKHLTGHLLRWPALWLPLIGAAYSRAKESTCDRHGLACCDSPEGAARSLAVLSAGAKRWERLDIGAYFQQMRESGGFWMSFHELVSGYPWLSKRVARVMDIHTELPKRNGFSYFLALFVPYSGRLGPGFSFFVMIYIVAVSASIGIPAYKDYTVKAKVVAVMNSTEGVRQGLGRYYESKKQAPESLSVIGISPSLPNGTQLSLDTKAMVLTVTIPEGDIIFIPKLDNAGHIVWGCKQGRDLKASQLPSSCKIVEKDDE